MRPLKAVLSAWVNVAGTWCNDSGRYGLWETLVHNTPGTYQFRSMIQPVIRLHGRGYAWLIGAYLCGYVALDWVSYLYPMAPPLAITPWNPQTGLSLALLLRSGPRNAPWLFVASLAADLLVRGPHMPPLLTVAMSALPAAVYTVLAALLRGPFRLDPDFATLRDATILVAAVSVGAGLLALGFVGVLDLAGFLPAVSFGKSVAQFWIGDLIGIVVTTPLLLVFTRASAPRLQVPPSEATLQAGLVVATLWLVFGSHLFDELKLFYILFLPLMWIAMRHGIEGTTIATLVIQVGLIVAMWLGGYGAGAVLEFQFLLLAVAITGLFLGLTVSERREIALQLREKQFELDRSLRLVGASELASALAHELNQPLSAIGSYVRACQLMIGGERDTPKALKDTMEKVVVRGHPRRQRRAPTARFLSYRIRSSCAGERARPAAERARHSPPAARAAPRGLAARMPAGAARRAGGPDPGRNRVA